MKIEYELTFTDYLEFNTQFHKDKKITRIVTSLMFALPVYLNTFNMWELTLSVKFAGLIGIIAGIYLLMPAFYRFILKLQVKKMVNMTNGTILGHKVLTFSEEGISEKTSLSEMTYQWASVQSVKNHPKAIHIFVDKAMAFIVPKRSLTSEQEKELTDLLEQFSKKNKP